MPPPTISELMQIPNGYSTANAGIDQAMANFQKQQEEQRQQHMKLQMMNAEMERQIAVHKATMGMDQQAPLYQAQLQQANQNIGQNGQMPMSMKWAADNEAAKQSAEQERMIAVDKAKQLEEQRIKKEDPAYIQDQKFYEQYGPMIRGGQQFASQSNFNPIMGDNPVYKGQNTSVGGINFNPMNPIAQQQNKPYVPEGYIPNPNFRPGEKTDRFVKGNDSVISSVPEGYKIGFDKNGKQILQEIKDAKPPTAGQETTALYASRIKQANDVFTKMEGYINKLPVVGTELNKWAPNFMKSGDYQSYEQAQRNFLNAVLRRESGAVISPSEFSEGRKQYFPQPGDKPDVIAQKRDNRELVMKNFIASARDAYVPYEQTAGQPESGAKDYSALWN